MSDINKFLEHHGVKGQKWGRRNSKNKKKFIKDLHTKYGTISRKTQIRAIIGTTALAVGTQVALEILTRKKTL